MDPNHAGQSTVSGRPRNIGYAPSGMDFAKGLHRKSDVVVLRSRNWFLGWPRFLVDGYRFSAIVRRRR